MEFQDCTPKGGPHRCCQNDEEAIDDELAVERIENRRLEAEADAEKKTSEKQAALNQIVKRAWLVKGLKLSISSPSSPRQTHSYQTKKKGKRF